MVKKKSKIIKRKKKMNNLFEVIKKEWLTHCQNDSVTHSKNKYGFTPFKSESESIKLVKFSFYNQRVEQSIRNFDKLISALYHIPHRFKYVRWAVEKDFSKYNGNFKPKFQQIDLYVLFVLPKSPFFKDILEQFNIDMSVSSNRNFSALKEAFDFIEFETESISELKELVKAEIVSDEYKPIHSLTESEEIEVIDFEESENKEVEEKRYIPNFDDDGFPC
ncbi:MAG: hypothetical protein FWE53_02415 [Firmicutes bacterium]|nr:hypothetical protein [Bacillota bacterium]